MECERIKIMVDTSEAVSEMKKLKIAAEDVSNVMDNINMLKWKLTVCGLAGTIIGYIIGVW